MKQKPKSDPELIEFAVADTASIDKIVIQDPNFKPFTLQRSGKIWTDGEGGCINQQSVQFILETFKKILDEKSDRAYGWENQQNLRELLDNKFKTDIEDTQDYKECTTWKLPDETVKTCQYTYPAVGDLDEKTKKIKDLYSNNNLNSDKATFNGKVTFN